ncbi:MAG TPA: HAD-IA family hydrolase [Polyangiaceae bacterium]|jgi:phosphoglycolate phosphatase
MTALKRPEAMLFDLDGTLVDSKLDIAAACNHALTSVDRAPLPVEAIAGFVGDGARILVRRALGADAPEVLVERALTEFHRYYEEHPAVFTTLMPGALALLDALHDRPVALVTNKPRIPTLAVLRTLGVAERFARVQTGTDGPLKPDPKAILEVLAWIRIEPSRAWMVGDGEQDVRAGRAAGCVTIGVRGGLQGDARLVASEPDVVVDGLADLVARV